MIDNCIDEQYELGIKKRRESDEYSRRISGLRDRINTINKRIEEIDAELNQDRL